MSDALNTVDTFLQAAALRLLPPPTAAVVLDATANTFAVSGPTGITFTAKFIDMSGTVTFSSSGGTLTSISGNTCVLLASNMPGTTATVTASITYRGTLFSATQAISKVADGAAGTNGLNNAVAYAYQRSASAPSGTPGAVTYDFTTNTITTGSLANGWLKTIPAGSNPLYVTAATASSTTSTDTIATGEWSTAVVLAQDGASGGAGANGLNVASVFIYQRNGTGTAPTLPSATTTYTFATGGLTGLNNGWTTTVPAIGGGAYLFVSVATASNTTSTDTIASGEWAAVQIMAQNGANGSNGTNGTDGARGAGTFYATGGSWSDATANTATPGSNVLDDVVTISNGSTFVASKRWDGSAWQNITQVIDGSLLVTGSVAATKITASNLQAISALIGLLRTATSGARTEIADNVIRVYDSSNVLRVKIGDLS
jgi:hypothetical protein